MRVETAKSFKIGDYKVERGERLFVKAVCWGDNYGGMFYLVTDTNNREFLVEPKMLDISSR
mgnify:CR=1 FL=1|tara:strand:- start:294 stop:476 length:183 start_codon:yes stop_codon:yes gene_type:complete